MNLNRLDTILVLVIVLGACQLSLAAVTGQYPFEGGAANDTSGFARNGTLIGGPTIMAPGLYKNSAQSLQVSFGQNVQLPPMTDFIRNAPGATLAAWVRLDMGGPDTRTIMVVNNGDTASTTGIGDARANIQVAGGQFRALGRQADGGGSSNTVGYAPELGASYFVAGVFDYLNGAIRLFVDGQQVSSSTTDWAENSADTANLVARIGGHANGTDESWIGAIDGARIYDEALTAANILNLYRTEALNPVIPGDVDGDGFAMANDLTPIRQNYLKSVSLRSDGDLTGDRIVDFADFRQWKTAVLGGGGSLEGLDLSFATVPEPSAIVLLVLGGFGLSVAGRNRRRAGVHLLASRREL